MITAIILSVLLVGSPIAADKLRSINQRNADAIAAQAACEAEKRIEAEYSKSAPFKMKNIYPEGYDRRDDECGEVRP